MALTKTSPAPTFEDMDDGDTTSVAAPETVAANEAAQSPVLEQVKKIIANPVAPVTQGGLALSRALKSNTALDDLQNVIGTEMLEGMGHSAFPRITVAPGAFTDKKSGKSLGDTLVVELHSWNFVTIVSANENNQEANKLVRSSYDGVNLTNNEGSVEDYLAKLRADDYDKATAKKYGELYVTVISTGKGGDVPEEDQTLTQISIPPTSLGQWGAFLLSQRMAQAKGKEVSARIKLVADSQSKNGNTWGVVEFKAA